MDKKYMNTFSGPYFLGFRDNSEYDKASVVVLPVSFEGTCSFGLGTKFGAEALIEASYFMEPYEEEADVEVDEIGINTLKLQKFKDSADPKAVSNTVKTIFSQILADNKFPVLVGGEHSLSIGSIQAVAEKYQNLSVLQIDAHTDLDNGSKDREYHHAAMARTVSESTDVRFTQVGIRSCIKDHLHYAKEKNIPIFFAHNIVNGRHKLSEITQTLRENVYITIDVDAFDPSLFPLTGTPEPNGLKWQYVINLVTQVAKTKNIVGLDLVEHASEDGSGNHHSDYNAARLLFKVLAILHKYK